MPFMCLRFSPSSTGRSVTHLPGDTSFGLELDVSSGWDKTLDLGTISLPVHRTLGTWTHFALTFDGVPGGGGRMISIYQNGVWKKSWPDSYMNTDALGLVRVCSICCCAHSAFW